MEKEILELTKKFVSIKSFDGNSTGLNEVLDLALSYLQDYKIERFEREGIPSALVYNTATRPKKFKVLFNVHLDVVPGLEENYIPKIKNGRLYGVGSMDMKGNAAAAILLFKELAKDLNYPVAVQLVTDEEVGGFNGTKLQVEKGARADFVIATEPTNFDIVHKAKGVFWVKILANGVTAHGAYPWRGDNAIWKINTFLNNLKKKFPIPKKEVWATTVNLSKVETTNNSINKIPSDCAASLDIRFVEEDKKTIEAQIKNLAKELKLKLEVVEKEPPMFTAKDNKYLVELAKATTKNIKNKAILRGANGTSDARHFADVGCPGVEFGPIGGGIGSDEEWVDIKSLKTYSDILKDFLIAIGTKN